jgi:hypothetical protein
MKAAQPPLARFQNLKGYRGRCLIRHEGVLVGEWWMETTCPESPDYVPEENFNTLGNEILAD